jgi:hypothetical protein
MPGVPRARRIILLLSAAIATVAMLLVVRAPVQASTTPGAEAAITNVVSIAMGSLNQWEGECFPWVRRVIAAATGRTIGWDYHLGYLEAGAVEVPLDSVQQGDVVQTADPSNSGGDASYAGLHTAIVMQNHGGGMLTVIDSNSQWDGVVRIRNDYNPAALAARYAGLTARAYRFPGVTAVDPLAPTSTVADSTLTVGGSAIVSADGDCLRLRSSSGVGGTILTCLPDATVVTVLEGTAVADGLTWRAINAQGSTGWVAEQYLQALGTGAAPPASTLPPSTTPISTTPAAPPAQTADGTLSGNVPVSGGVGLVVWSGGTTTAFLSAAQGQGCGVTSVWTTANGGFVGYTAGAPAFVNRSWENQYPGGIPAASALVLLCRGAGATTPPPATSTPPPVGATPAPPASGSPPGPAGNDG